MIIIAKQNEGKIFEKSFVASIPDYCWHKRLNDNAASWGNGTQTRFTSTNECDFLLFDCNTRTLSALELKTTSGLLTYWREDFEEKEGELDLDDLEAVAGGAGGCFLSNAGCKLFGEIDSKGGCILIGAYV